MQPSPVAFYKKAARAAAIAGWCLCIAYSLSPFDFARTGSFGAGGVSTPREAAVLLLHLLTFAALGSLDRLASGTKAFPVRPFARGLLFCVAIEVGQAFSRSRHAELLDLAMNSGGIFLGHLSLGWFLRPGGSGHAP